MLKSIRIENIAVIEKCNIDFCDGFNCLTGETGAGKSIIIDSIHAVTGQRTSKELVRTGCEKASVSAVFDDLPAAVTERLSDYGIDADDGSIMMLRTIGADGRNTCRINGAAVTTAVLREIGDMLVNIHGQHDNQALLNPENHCGFIDAYGNYGGDISAYRDCYSKLKDVKRKLKALTTDENEKERKIDLLNYQVNEIDAARITPGELERLKARRDVMRNSEHLQSTLGTCLNILSGDDDTAGAESLCSSAAMEFMSSSKLLHAENLSERLTAAAAEISDITAEIRELCDGVSFDIAELEECEQRIDLLNSLIKKYGGSEEAALEFCENAKTELENITHSDALIKELLQQSDALEDELVAKGAVLTEKRKTAAARFSEKICDVLRYLEMPNVVFSAKFSEGMYTVDGCDKVEFLISANSGQEAKPLAKIASGGELSRIMLAIKSVMGRIGDAETLIFDEIDAGISGKAADKVGRQLKSLSEERQILCVTHLAQIAAAASNHLLITKSSTADATYTEVEPVEGDRRICEIARMMSGGKMTENLYISAKELIDHHRQI